MKGNLAMRDRKEIEIEYFDARQSGDDNKQHRCLLEALLDIRDQGQPVEVLAESLLTKDRVVLQINYTSYLLSETMTSQDIVTLLRFFDSVQELNYDNEITDKRSNVEIHMVPRDKIKMPIDPDAVIPFTQAEVTRDDSDQKLNRHAFQPMEGDEEYCGVEGCHLTQSDDIHDEDRCPHCGALVPEATAYTDTIGAVTNEMFCNKEHLEAYRAQNYKPEL